MKVILTQDVKSLGKKGDVVEVKEGYGRNFLIPRGLAVAADEGNLRRLKHEQAVQKSKEAREREEAEQVKAQLEQLTVTLRVKTGEKGRLFGSITAGDVADELAKHGIEIDRRKIELDEPIKSLGAYTVTVRVYPGVTAQLKVVVEAA
ncbi:MAG: 50S ribosomal protein L9 [Firmicutes bacterium]|nr:50S ribosomal protein L9 [Bacillota bacterium]